MPLASTAADRLPAHLPSPPRPQGMGQRGLRLRSKRAKTALIVLLTAFIAGAGGWMGIRHTTWLGPWLADTLRLVIGVEAVARLEDFSAWAEDRWRSLGPERAPRSLDELRPPAPPSIAAPRPSDPSSPDEAASPPQFRPLDVGPMFAKVAAPGDGTWQPVSEAGLPGESAILWTTLLHPDARRPWAEVFVVAIDPRRTKLNLVAGTVHPEASNPAARSYERHGLIPPAERSRVVAAFNGGFKAEHGRYGMHVDGVTLIAARDVACTVAAYENGALRIATWTSLGDQARGLVWWRQTPPCLVERGRVHPALRDESERRWGAMPDGETVIRRSALGLAEGGGVMFMAVSNFTTATALALALRHAGAWDVAELDVNWSFPHFVLFRPDASGELRASGLFKGFLFDEHRYLQKPSPRDFFYLMRENTATQP